MPSPTSWKRPLKRYGFGDAHQAPRSPLGGDHAHQSVRGEGVSGSRGIVTPHPSRHASRFACLAGSPLPQGERGLSLRANNNLRHTGEKPVSRAAGSTSVALDSGFPRDDENRQAYPVPIPASQSALTMHPPRPSKGRSREALRRRGGMRRLRVSSQRGTRAAAELPPGPNEVPPGAG
jgi:hypothetical protein